MNSMLQLALSSFALAALASLGVLDAVEVRVEAEGTTHHPAVASDWAWGGQAASSNHPWEPLLHTALPASAPTGEVRLWVRSRLGPVCVKALKANGEQDELGWVWSATHEFAWNKLGNFSAARLAGGLLVIRGDRSAQADAQLDCVVLSDVDQVPATPPLPPRPGTEVLTIAWSSSDAAVRAPVTTELSFGLNLFHAFEPALLNDPRYRANLLMMRPGFLRLHNGGQSGAVTNGGIWDLEAKTLDAAQIATLCQAWKGLAPNFMMNISGWPAWMDADGDGRLDEAQISAYASACGEFVRLVNISGKVGIHWWETVNEKDDPYYLKVTPPRHAELARIHQACAVAMKAVDPTILVGGPSAARPDKVDDLLLFARAAGNSLDFMSFHAYGSGSASDSDEHMFERTEQMADQTTALSRAIDQTLGRKVPAFFDEYNISWTWETRDERMTNHFSAMFDALIMAKCANRGMTSTAAWNECDGIYGKMDNQFKLRPSATVFARLNRDFIGQVATVNAPPTAPVCLAVRHADRTRAVMLINTDIRTVHVSLPGLDPGSALSVAVLADGVVNERVSTWAQAATGFDLPGRSVTWLMDSVPTVK